jgi:hypothetical protein
MTRPSRPPWCSRPHPGFLRPTYLEPSRRISFSKGSSPRQKPRAFKIASRFFGGSSALTAQRPFVGRRDIGGVPIGLREVRHVFGVDLENRRDALPSVFAEIAVGAVQAPAS